MTRGSLRRVLLGSVALAATVLLASLPVVPMPGSQAGGASVRTVEVSAVSAQEMNGFGASGAWWPNDLARFPLSVQARVADLLFSADGIALSVYRYNIGGGGVGVTSPARAVPTFLRSPGVYDWSADPGGVRFLRLAHKHKVPVLEGFVNSAPPVWTTDHKSCGGQLIAGEEDAYASYLADVTRHFATDGIALDVVSPMNEPDNSFATCGQEGMAVPVDQRAAVVVALSRALARRSTPAGVIADESSLATFQFLPEVPEWLPAVPLPRRPAALAHHAYEYPTDAQAAMVSTLGARFGKPLWMTEICCYDGKGPLVGFGQQYDPTMTSGLWLADSIYQDIAVIGDSQFDWWTALSSSLGCDPTGGTPCTTAVNGTGWNDGLLYYDPAYASDGNHSIYRTKRYFVMGNFSRYIRPGAVRHFVTGAPAGVQVLAFENGGAWSVVVINDNSSNMPSVRLAIHLPNGEASRPRAAVRTSSIDSLTKVALPHAVLGTEMADIPSQSVTTYTFGS